MKRLLKILFLVVFNGTFLFFGGLYILRNLHQEKQQNLERKVFVLRKGDSYSLVRNGKPFKILGASGHSHIRDLALIGGNTIRVYDTIAIKSVLDEAELNNVSVIIDLFMPAFNNGYSFYENPENTIWLEDGILKTIKKYKSHPALLMWNLGNELNYPIVIFENEFIETFNRIIDRIHEEDPDHPVSTAVLWKSDVIGAYLHSPQLDLVCMNVFGDIGNLERKTKRVFDIIGPVPYFISEWGPNGPWEEGKTMWGAPVERNSTKKAEIVKERYSNFIKKNEMSLGSLIFYWGYKQEVTHTWFSIFDRNGNKSQIFYELASLWGENKSNTLPPRVKRVMIDGRDAWNQVVLKCGELKEARVELESRLDSSLRFDWAIYEEGWGYTKMKMPQKIEGCFSETNVSEVYFKAPDKEGPYRLFAYVYDSHGNFATENIPFYVLH